MINRCRVAKGPARECECVRYTIKDGIVYDAKELLSDVARIVREAKQEAGKEIVQPGLAPVVERN